MSVEPESDFHVDLGSHGLAIFAPGFEAPHANRFQRFFVETQADGAHDFKVVRQAITTHDHPEQHRTLKFGAPGFFWVLRLGRIQLARSCNSDSGRIWTAANSRCVTE